MFDSLLTVGVSGVHMLDLIYSPCISETYFNSGSRNASSPPLLLISHLKTTRYSPENSERQACEGAVLR